MIIIMMKYYFFSTCVLILNTEQQNSGNSCTYGSSDSHDYILRNKTSKYSQNHGKRDVEKQSES